MEVIGDMELIGGDLLVGAANGVKDIEFESDVPTSSSGTCSSKNADLTYFLGDLTTIDVGGFSIKMEGYSSNKKIKKEETALQDSTVNHRLCVPVEHYGKAAVMALSNFGNLPRFSKYCGTLEWQNCVYLWVNIGGTSGYSNAFSEGGRHMMWYGGSKMHKGKLLNNTFALYDAKTLITFKCLTH